MKVLITGGSDSSEPPSRQAVGTRQRSKRLMRRSHLEQMVLIDVVQGHRSTTRASTCHGDIMTRNSSRARSIRIRIISHLAALSRASGSDFELGMRLMSTLAHSRRPACSATGPKFGFEARWLCTRRTAGAGARHTALPRSHPMNAESVVELFLTITRKGFIYGRVLRLPTICVRPGRPTPRASSFASGIIREPRMENRGLPGTPNSFGYCPATVIEALGWPDVAAATWPIEHQRSGFSLTVGDMARLYIASLASSRQQNSRTADPRIERIVRRGLDTGLPQSSRTWIPCDEDFELSFVGTCALNLGRRCAP